jgi:hypothetical protein
MVVVIGVLVGAWYVAVPKLASHFGWATRWPSSMPSAVNFSGRDYGSPTRCRALGKTPLHGRRGYKVGSVPVLLGASMPILESRPRRPGQPAEVGIIVRRYRGCFVVYGLEGGP